MDNSRKRILQWTFEDYQDHVARPEGLTGEGAYTAYQFARACGGAVTTEAELLRRRAQYQAYYEHNKDRLSKDYLDQTLDQIERSLVHCQGMGADVIGAAMDWLLLSAELGYLPARIKFHEDVVELLEQDQWRVFRQPELLDLYGQRSVLFLEQALESGHPDAFRAYALALERGFAFDQDTATAQAYRWAADLAEGGDLPDPQQAAMMTGLSDVSDLRALAVSLCEQYCR